MEQQQKMIDLEVENSRLQEDLSKERHGHSIAQAELQAGTDQSQGDQRGRLRLPHVCSGY